MQSGAHIQSFRVACGLGRAIAAEAAPTGAWRLQTFSNPVGAASAAMLLAALDCPGLHPGYNTSRLSPLLDPSLRSARRRAGAFKTLEISSMSRPGELLADSIFRVIDSCQFADKKL